MAARTLSPNTSGRGIIYWNLQWDVPLRCVCYSEFLGETRLLKCHWDPTVSATSQIYWNALYLEYNVERGRRGGSRSGIPHPQAISSLLTALPSPANLCGIHNQVRFPLKDQATSVIFFGKEDYPIQVPTKYWFFFNLDSWCSCGIWSLDGHLMEMPFYHGPTCMPRKGSNPAAGYVGSCPSLAHQDYHSWHHHSREGIGRPETSSKKKLGLNSPDTTDTDPEAWPVA